MENGIDNLLEPVNKKYVKIDEFFIIFQNSITKKIKEEKKPSKNKRIKKQNEKNEPLYKNNDKKYEKQISKEINQFEENNSNEIFNTINSKFENIPYYELFK